jgi:hypothetical protein
VNVPEHWDAVNRSGQQRSKIGYAVNMQKVEPTMSSIGESKEQTPSIQYHLYKVQRFPKSA